MAMSTMKKGSLAALVTTIISGVVVVEGGYVDNPKDPGGKTNHGITEKVARDHGFDGHMKDLTKAEAVEIYAEDYVYKPGFDGIAALSPALGTRVIDGGVNVGTRQVSLWFQRSLNAVNRDGKDYANISVDGKIGAGTVAAYAALEKKRGRVEACKMMIKMLDGQQTVHYMSLDKLQTFTPGWIINRIGHVPLERCNEKAPS